MADSALRRGEASAAYELFDQHISAGYSSERSYFGRGQAREALGDLQGALEDYHAALKLDPHYQVAHFRRAIVYFKQENFKQTVKDITYLINHMTSYHYTNFVLKGLCLLGDPIRTVSDLSDIQSDMYYIRALSYDQMGFRTPTLMDLDMAISLNNYEASYYCARARVHLALTERRFAKQDLLQAFEIDPHDHVVIQMLSEISDDQERQQWENLLIKEKGLAAQYSQKARQFYQRGLLDKALMIYDSALLIESSSASDLMGRGLVNAGLGNHREAVDDFKKSLELDDSLVKNYILAGNSCREIGNYSQAIEYYQMYLAKADPDPSVFLYLGMSYMKYQSNIEACRSFRRSIELGEERAERYMNEVCFESKNKR